MLVYSVVRGANCYWRLRGVKLDMFIDTSNISYISLKSRFNVTSVDHVQLANKLSSG